MSIQVDKSKNKKVMAKRSDSNGRANEFSEVMKAKAKAEPKASRESAKDKPKVKRKG